MWINDLERGIELAKEYITDKKNLCSNSALRDKRDTALAILENALRNLLPEEKEKRKEIKGLIKELIRKEWIVWQGGRKIDRFASNDMMVNPKECKAYVVIGREVRVYDCERIEKDGEIFYVIKSM